MPDYSGWLGKLYKEQGRRKLSQSSVETLAIVAYKQPITKAEIEKIRGVNCDYVLKSLLEKELLTVTGRAVSVGRPLLYGTTKEFLKHFGLNDITDLPRPREIEEILGESQFETERRMLEAQAGAEQVKKEQEDFKSRLPHIPKKKTDLDEKEVEIIPQKKMRQIRIVSAEHRKALEKAGQETIEFNIADTLQSDRSQSISTAVERIQTELPIVPLAKSYAYEIVEQTTAIQIPRELEVETPSIASESIAELTTVVQQPEIVIESTKSAIEIKEVTEEAEEKAQEIKNVQHPKRWRVWKEKIQGFIRKLFA